MPLNEPFLPSNNACVTIGVTNVATATVLPTGPASGLVSTHTGGECLELMNRGTSDVFIETSPNGALAAVVATSYCVPAGADKVIRRGIGDTGINCIASVAGPTTLIVCVGNGN